MDFSLRKRNIKINRQQDASGYASYSSHLEFSRDH